MIRGSKKDYEDPRSSMSKYRVLWPTAVGFLLSFSMTIVVGIYNYGSIRSGSVDEYIRAIFPDTGNRAFVLILPPLVGLVVTVLIRIQEIKEAIAASNASAKQSASELRTELIGETGLVTSLPDLQQPDLEKIAGVAGRVAAMNKFASANPRISKLLEWRKSSQLAEIEASFRGDASGHSKFSAEEEIPLNNAIIVNTTPKMIKAISIDDIEYWKSSSGKLFIRQQVDYISSINKIQFGGRQDGNEESVKVQICRIFVIKPGEDYSESMAEQHFGGIEVWSIKHEDFLASYRTLRGSISAIDGEDDFVIYDDAFVKKSRIIGKDGAGVFMKDPEIYSDLKTVKEFVSLFETIKTSSQKFVPQAGASKSVSRS